MCCRNLHNLVNPCVVESFVAFQIVQSIVRVLLRFVMSVNHFYGFSGFCQHAGLVKTGGFELVDEIFCVLTGDFAGKNNAEIWSLINCRFVFNNFLLIFVLSRLCVCFFTFDTLQFHHFTACYVFIAVVYEIVNNSGVKVTHPCHAAFIGDWFG